MIEGSPIPDCLNALSDYPNDLTFSAGGALPDIGRIKVFFYLAQISKSVNELHLFSFL